MTENIKLISANFKKLAEKPYDLSKSFFQRKCESVLESFVSMCENHFDEQRNVKEDTANEEFEISVNEPNLAHRDSIIIEALNLYWEGKPWRFYRTYLVEKLVAPLHQH